MLGKTNRSHLLDQALSETVTMIEKAEQVFAIAWDKLTEGPNDTPFRKLDDDINAGERMVRRLILEHLTLNPDQDLAFSLTLISVVHDVERLGDYAKSIVELSGWAGTPLSKEGLGGKCFELHEQIAPMFQLTIQAIRDDNVDKASALMDQHRVVKAGTDEVARLGLSEGQSPDTVLAVLVSRFLRRISAHLSNVTSVVANSFDRVARDL